MMGIIWTTGRSTLITQGDKITGMLGIVRAVVLRVRGRAVVVRLGWRRLRWAVRSLMIRGSMLDRKGWACVSPEMMILRVEETILGCVCAFCVRLTSRCFGYYCMIFGFSNLPVKLFIAMYIVDLEDIGLLFIRLVDRRHCPALFSQVAAIRC